MHKKYAMHSFFGEGGVVVYTSIRIPKTLKVKVNELKARLMLQQQAKVSDAEVVRQAVDFALADPLFSTKKRKTSLLSASGFISGEPSDASKDRYLILHGARR